MPVRFFITSGTTADCTVAARLIEGFQAEYLLADRGYDTDAIILQAMEQECISCKYGLNCPMRAQKKPSMIGAKVMGICEEESSQAFTQHLFWLIVWRYLLHVNI